MVAVLFVVPFALYWFWALLFCIVDLTEKPALLYRRKLQTKKLTWGEMKEAAKTTLPDHVFFVLVFICLLPFLPSEVTTFSSSESGTDCVKFLIKAYCVQTVGFYYLHRLFHTKALYKFHKIHHQWTYPTSLVASNAHPLENIVVHAAPMALSVFLFRPHTDAFLLFLIWAVSQAAFDHSGYALVDQGHHDRHHANPGVNFGIWYLDYLHGTLDDKTRTASFSFNK